MVPRSQDVKGGRCACFHRLSLEVSVFGYLLSVVRYHCIMMRMTSVGMWVVAE